MRHCRITPLLFAWLVFAPLAYGETGSESGVVKGNSVNFRSEPDLKGQVISVLNRGLTVSILEEKEEWYRVQLADGRQGWVYRQYITLQPLQEVNSRGRSGGSPVNVIIAYAKNFLGISYVYGGASPRGFDCSGFTKYVFSRIGIDLPRQAREQITKGTPIPSRAELVPGDLVFFKTKGSSIVNHVGIYLGGYQFIHASSGYGAVRISPLDSGYYDRCYVGGRRLLADGAEEVSVG